MAEKTEPWLNQLILEYTEGKKRLEVYRNQLDKNSPEDEKEDELVGSMISDMQYALDWLKRGSRPGNRRGAEKHSVYQRTILLDTDIFPSLQIEPEKDLDRDNKRKIVDILWKLSKRERECFILYNAYGHSQRSIAEELKISRRVVRVHLERAEEKIKNINLVAHL